MSTLLPQLPRQIPVLRTFESLMGYGFSVLRKLFIYQYSCLFGETRLELESMD